MCDAIICQENERVVDHQCEPCLVWESNAAGDSAVGADTACDPPADVCFAPRVVNGNNAVLGFEFVVMRDMMELASGCEDDFDFTEQERMNWTTSVAENFAGSPYDEGNQLQWRARLAIDSERANVRFLGEADEASVCWSTVV